MARQPHSMVPTRHKERMKMTAAIVVTRAAELLPRPRMQQRLKQWKLAGE